MLKRFKCIAVDLCRRPICCRLVCVAGQFVAGQLIKTNCRRLICSRLIDRIPQGRGVNQLLSLRLNFTLSESKHFSAIPSNFFLTDLLHRSRRFILPLFLFHSSSKKLHSERALTVTALSDTLQVIRHQALLISFYSVLLHLYYANCSLPTRSL